MRCPQCQHENPPGANFCLQCGARQGLTCGSCGTELPGGSRFCKQCGNPVASPAPAEPRFAAPESYTPKHLAEKILTSRSALEGERKQVTVLFADLKGSMELLADRDPEEARKLLDPVLERMMEAVHRYEGTVNQVMGDGIMALFGAPVAHEDHAVRACYAALDMQRAIRRYAEEVRRARGIGGLQIRVGLNSGEVVVRAIGNDLHMDYSAIGQTTHLAARMEQLATPGSTMLSADTLRLAEGFVEVEPLGPVAVKGLEVPVDVYEMTGAGPRRSRLHAAAARGLTRFVGRDTELEQLRQALGRAASGHGQVVAIVGEAGVGKSRLVWEVTHSHHTHGWLILESRSVSYGKGSPYLPVIDLLKGYFAIQDRDEPRALREKVTGKLLTLEETLKPTLPVFLSLLDVPVDDTAWQALDPPQRRQRTLDALKRLLFRESQVQPLLVVFEDLHWIDGESQAFLDSLVESLPTARLLLLVNYRPEYEPRWVRKTYYAQLRLDPLPPESAEALLRGLLGADPSLTPLTPLLIERTEGNPFFLEECVRALVETHAVVGAPGAYRLDAPLPRIQVPATVQTVLASRIDRLPPEHKNVLQIASAIGKDVPYPLLEATAEVPDATLRQGLRDLQGAEFLCEIHFHPQLEYAFKHALTHEVTYASLLQERRRALHGRIVEASEQLYAERLSEHAESLAHHALRGEVWDKALRYLQQAGTKALMRSAYREALRRFEEALELLPRLADSRRAQELAVDLRLHLRTTLIPLGELRRVITHLREAETLARRLGDRNRLGWASVYLCQLLWLTADTHGALRAGHDALAIADAQDDATLRSVAPYYLGTTHWLLGDYRRALEWVTRAITSLRGDVRRPGLGWAGYPAVAILARGFAVLSLGELGEFREAATSAGEALRLAEELDHPYELSFADWAVGTVHCRQGALAQAIAQLERGAQVCRSGSIPFMEAAVNAVLGYAYVLAGRVEEGLPLVEQGVEGNAAHGVAWGMYPLMLGESYLVAGRVEAATLVATRTLAHVSESQRGTEAWTLRLLGEVAAHGNDAETAERRYGEAMTLATELGMRPLLAHCHRGLGGLYRRIGNGTKATEHFATAKTMYREMDMPYWLEKAEAALEPPHGHSP